MAKINLYGCGGAGINIASRFLPYLDKKDFGFSEFSLCFIDTSSSNISKDIPKENIYLVEGLDGSGKKRDSNYKAISERSKEIIQKFKPGEINVIIHSASGGSGSVIGPILAGEISSKAPTVIIMVGSSDSRIETDNTVKTLKTYEVISNKKGYPIAAMYYENSKETPRGKVDSEIHLDLALLSILYSGENLELDTADLSNFINYNNVTSFAPSLARLEFFVGDIDIGKDQIVASVVTLTDMDTDSGVNIPVEYQAVGFITEEVKRAISKDSLNATIPMHACMILGYFNPMIERLEKKLKDFNEYKSALVHKTIANSGNIESATDDGLLF